MKPIYTLLALLLSSILVFAQKNNHHEIGIGVGYIEVNPYSENYLLNFSPKWKFNTIFKQSNYSNFNFKHKDLKDIKSFSTPSIYYGNTISKHSSLRASYQYAYERGSVNIPQSEYFKAGTFNYELKQSNISFGYSYKLFIRNYLQVNLATDFEMIYSKTKTNEIVSFGGYGWEEWFYSEIDENSFIYNTQMDFYLQQIIGFKIPLSKNFNINYELSGKFVEAELRLKPLNRLSLNYGF